VGVTVVGKEQYIFPVQIRLVYNETMTGPVDGNNVTFQTINEFVPGSISVYLNGLKQREGLDNDFVFIDNNTIAMNNPPLAGDVLVCDYTKLSC
jgi:hypothetical protein